MEDTVALAALIGIDWADQHHDVAVQEAGADQAEHERLPHTPEAIGSWMAALRHRFGNRPVGIAVETSRGPLIHALLGVRSLLLDFGIARRWSRALFALALVLSAVVFGGVWAWRWY